MLRIASALAISIAALMLALPETAAAASPHSRGFRPAMPMKFAGNWHGRREIGASRRFGFHHRQGRRFVAGGGFYPYAFGNGTTTIVQEPGDEPERMVDRNSFEHMPASTGIERPPLAAPVIYRIEGTKARPTVRVMRVGIDDRRAGYRHLASAEGGNPEILTLRPR